MGLPRCSFPQRCPARQSISFHAIPRSCPCLLSRRRGADLFRRGHAIARSPLTLRSLDWSGTSTQARRPRTGLAKRPGPARYSPGPQRLQRCSRRSLGQWAPLSAWHEGHRPDSYCEYFSEDDGPTAESPAASWRTSWSRENRTAAEPLRPEDFVGTSGAGLC